MPGVSRKLQDTAGGLILDGAATVFVNGKAAVVKDSNVQPHGAAPHGSATLVEGSSIVFVNGKPLVRAGDKASCGHAAVGSPNVLAGG